MLGVLLERGDMADNTEESKAAEETAPVNEEPIDTGMNADQSFAFWLVLLPFVAFAGVQIYEFSQGSPGDSIKLINAAGLIVVGVFLAYFVNAFTQGDDNSAEGQAEEAKPEGSG